MNNGLMITRRLKNNKGVAMITAYIFLSVVITLVASFAISAVNELSNARRYRDSKQAFWIAEAGIQKVMQLLKTGTTYASTTTINENYSTGNYSITVVPSGNIYTITSTGTANSLSRKLRQTVQTGADWPAAFDYAMFGNGGTMTVRENGSVVGNIFQYGNVHIDQNASVSPYVYTTGSVTAGQNSSYTQGTLPNPMPTFPVLNTSLYFDPQITQASQSGINGNQTYNSLDLSGGNIYVKGNVTLNQNGHITGPGVLVATGTVTINQNSTLDSNITIISGQKLTLDQNTTVGSNFVLYSSTAVEMQQNSTGNPSGIILTPGNVEIDQNGAYTGVVYAGGTIQIDQNARITGSVVAGATSGNDIQLDQNAYIIYDASKLPTSIPPGLAAVGGSGTLTVLNWEEITP